MISMYLLQEDNQILTASGDQHVSRETNYTSPRIPA